MKYKTRRSLAAASVDKLVETETRLNVQGRGKDQLYPKIINYVKKKCFESDKETDVVKDRNDCITSIDGKVRDIKHEKNKMSSSELQLQYLSAIIIRNELQLEIFIRNELLYL